MGVTKNNEKKKKAKPLVNSIYLLMKLIIYLLFINNYCNGISRLLL